MADDRTGMPMLSAQCLHCTQPVTLQIAAMDPDYRANAERGSDEGPVQPWVCPWCRERNEGRYPGLLTYVWKGHRQA